MKANMHTPERLANESRESYKIRRADSHKANSKMAAVFARGGTNSRQQQRDAMRANGTMGKRIRAYSALMDHFAKQRKLGNIDHALA